MNWENTLIKAKNVSILKLPNAHSYCPIILLGMIYILLMHNRISEEHAEKELCRGRA